MFTTCGLFLNCKLHFDLYIIYIVPHLYVVNHFSNPYVLNFQITHFLPTTKNQRTNLFVGNERTFKNMDIM